MGKDILSKGGIDWRDFREIFFNSFHEIFHPKTSFLKSEAKH